MNLVSNAESSKSNLFALGYFSFKYVDLPVLRAPHKNADCFFGKSKFKYLVYMTLS